MEIHNIVDLAFAFLLVCIGILALAFALSFIIDIKRDRKNDKD